MTEPEPDVGDAREPVCRFVGAGCGPAAVLHRVEAALTDPMRLRPAGVATVTCMDMLDEPDVRPAVRNFAATLLLHVPKCSVFWIEPSTTTDIRGMILQRYTGDTSGRLSPEARRLGEQVDLAQGQ